MDPAHFQIGDFRELVLQLGLDLARAFIARRKLHAGACIGDDDGNIGQRFPIFVFQVGVGQREKQAGEAQGPQHNAPAVPQSRKRDRRHAKNSAGREQLRRKEGEELNRPVHEDYSAFCMRLMPEAFQDRGHMDLI